jgi:hypothetical protein
MLREGTLLSEDMGAAALSPVRAFDCLSGILLPPSSAGGRLLAFAQRTLTDGVHPGVVFHASLVTGTFAARVSLRVVPGMVRAKSAPNAAAGLTAPDGDRASVSSTARMLAAAVKA